MIAVILKKSLASFSTYLITRRINGLWLLLIASLIAGKAAGAFAEDNNDGTHSVTLSVRTIQASEPHSGDDARSTAARTMKLDPAIRDLEPKLSQLPFDSFQLLSAKEEVIALKTRDSLQLPNGHSLTFRPIYLDSKRMGLWLNWRDQDGSEILNTRVHFDATDSVLTGTDCAQDKGLILAIKAADGSR
jgi:hypothetical protein